MTNKIRLPGTHIKSDPMFFASFKRIQGRLKKYVAWRWRGAGPFEFLLRIDCVTTTTYIPVICIE